MNEILREIHLNIQGAKTNIKHGQQIEEELIDTRLNEVNNLIEEIQNNKISKKKEAK